MKAKKIAKNLYKLARKKVYWWLVKVDTIPVLENIIYKPKEIGVKHPNLKKHYPTKKFEREVKKRAGNLRTAAVTFNSGKILEKNNGDEIDSKDVVFRINFMPTDNRKEKVGSRTTVRVMGREWIFKEKDEILIHTYNNKRYLKSDLKNHNKSRKLRESKIYVSKNDKINSFFRPLLGGMMTNGFRAVIIALSICDEVTIYGGDPSGAVSAESGGSIEKFPSEKEKKKIKRIMKKWNVEQDLDHYFDPIEKGEQSENIHSTLKSEYEFYRLHPRITIK